MMEQWLRCVLIFGISSLCILIFASIYSFCETIAHHSRTAGTMRWCDLWEHSSRIDKLCVAFEFLNICTDLIFALYLVQIHGDTPDVIMAGYLSILLAFIGFILLLIKLKLAQKLFNIFIEWKRQKTLLIEENIDITLPTHEDIVELHGILSDIKSHELDVAMFDLFGIALHNLPILAVIIILTLQDVLTFGGETEWNLDILPIICFLFTLLVICWKFKINCCPVRLQ